MHSFTSFHMSWSREKGRLCLLVSSLRVYTGSLTSQDYLWLNTFITGLRLMLSVFVAVSFPHMSDVKDKHALWTQRWLWTHSPWAAGSSGIVKPFEQLRVRGHSNFHHVGVWFYFEGPVVSAKHFNSVFLFCSVLYDEPLLAHWYPLSDLCSDTPVAIDTSQWLWLMNNQFLSGSWQRWYRNDFIIPCAKMKSHFYSLCWIFYIQWA